MRQIGEGRPATEQCPGGLLRLPSHLDYPLQSARALCRSRLQVRIGSKRKIDQIIRDFASVKCTQSKKINSEILY